MRFVLLVWVLGSLGCPKSGPVPAPVAEKPMTEPSGESRPEIGYVHYNRRCPSFGIAFSASPTEDPLAPERTCLRILSIENGSGSDDAKREAIKAFVDKQVQISISSTSADGTIQAAAIQLIH